MNCVIGCIGDYDRRGDVDNFKFMVGVRGKYVVFLKPVPLELSREDAIELAAWIIALTDPTGERTMASVTKIFEEE
jgi:hypothetical protein